MKYEMDINISEISSFTSNTISPLGPALMSAIINGIIMNYGTKGRISDVWLLISGVINSELIKNNPDTISKIIIEANATCASGKYNDVLKSNGEGVALIDKLNNLNDIAREYTSRQNEEAFLEHIRYRLANLEMDSELFVSPQLNRNK